LVKRAFDLTAASFGLLLLSPLLLLLALTVWAASGLPILFRHQRVGRRGQGFQLLKFRTMTVAPEAEQGSFEAGRPQRVTSIGRWLRRSKADELPQLWNVLRGDMSLVGPRPEVRRWVDAYPGRWSFVLAVRPGITDPASIRFRNEEEILAAAADPEVTYRDVILPQKLALYEDYVRQRSFWGDIAIILKTIAAVGWGKREKLRVESRNLKPGNQKAGS
jgi:lipopolysaccharide/colanic/teichoic acid biosynthesis glycosyltransferase